MRECNISIMLMQVTSHVMLGGSISFCNSDRLTLTLKGAI